MRQAAFTRCSRAGDSDNTRPDRFRKPVSLTRAGAQTGGGPRFARDRL